MSKKSHRANRKPQSQQRTLCGVQDTREKWRIFVARAKEHAAMVEKVSTMSDHDIELLTREDVDDLLHAVARELWAKRLRKRHKKDRKVGHSQSSVSPLVLTEEPLAAASKPGTETSKPVHFDLGALKNQLRILGLKPTEELKRLAQVGGGGFSLRLLNVLIRRRENPPPVKQHPGSEQKGKRKKKGERGKESRGSRSKKWNPPPPEQPGSVPCDGTHAEPDWWREHGE